MNGTETFPQYLRIALDIASRIAEGEKQEGQKISGRSLLACEYSVSPETIRRALKLLSDMKVVRVKENSGVYILSADNAKNYLRGFENQNQQTALRHRMRELFSQYCDINQQLFQTYSQLLKAQEAPLPSEQSLPNYEVRVGAQSPVIGKSIGSLQFWQATGATIIAIRRKTNTILSPGPYENLYEGDVVIFVGGQQAVQNAQTFVNCTDTTD